MYSYLSIVVVLVSFCFLSCNENNKPIIKVDGRSFYDGNSKYIVKGTNYWYGMHLAASDSKKDKERLIHELDELQSLGFNNLRILASAEGSDSARWRVQPCIQTAPGQYNDQLLEGLDVLLNELSKRNMTAVLVLNNFFQWSGGMAQYVSWSTGTEIPFPDENGKTWDDYQSYSARFFSDTTATQLFDDYLRFLIDRKNHINGRKYNEDPTIFSWQLCNEPRGYTNPEAYLSWVRDCSRYIQDLDTLHMVSLGGEGKTSNDYAATRFESIMKIQTLDYMTAHIWVENWGWHKPAVDSTFLPAVDSAMAYLRNHVHLAETISKPIIFEEFGISKDGGTFDPYADDTKRRIYFDSLYTELIQSQTRDSSSFAGLNFWSYSGLGTPEKPSGYWKKGGTLTGDPPHEKQGWYSVYSHDTLLLNKIRNHHIAL